jgi:hypothetical protein
MKASLLAPIAPGKIGAWVCLIAALLLWSPMLAAVWEANRMECCNGVQCPAHGHHAGKSGTEKKWEAAAQLQSEPDMECHRPQSSQSMKCSMSCCHDPQQVFAASILFVVPTPAQVSTTKLATDGPGAFTPQHQLASLEPLSPPPRRSAVSL